MEPLSPEQLSAIKKLIVDGRQIEAIKLHREATRSGLLEAKEAVEKLEAELREKSPELFINTERGRGCLGMIVLGCGLIVALVSWLLVR